MNDIVLRGLLVQLRGRLRRLWARFLGDRLGMIRGDRDVLMGKLEVYCGRLRERSQASDRDGWVSAPLPVGNDALEAGRHGSRPSAN